MGPRPPRVAPSVLREILKGRGESAREAARREFIRRFSQSADATASATGSNPSGFVRTFSPGGEAHQHFHRRHTNTLTKYWGPEIEEGFFSRVSSGAKDSFQKNIVRHVSRRSQRAAEKYEDVCITNPYIVSGVSATCFLITGDILAQYITSPGVTTDQDSESENKKGTKDSSTNSTAPKGISEGSTVTALPTSITTTLELDNSIDSFFNTHWDARRTLAMGLWGLCWYGSVQQFFWIKAYPKVVPRLLTPVTGLGPNSLRTRIMEGSRWYHEALSRVFRFGVETKKNLHAGTQSIMDAVLNQLVFYVPAFYMFTGTVKGQSLEQSFHLLQKEYLTACTGQAAFWIPVQFLNFRFVPVHMQTFVVSVCNIANKTWLSWLSNRERVAKHCEEASSDSSQETTVTVTTVSQVSTNAERPKFERHSSLKASLEGHGFVVERVAATLITEPANTVVKCEEIKKAIVEPNTVDINMDTKVPSPVHIK